MSTGEARPKRGQETIFVILGVIWLACAISLWSVRDPGTLVVESADPTPLGYTLSLSFFVLPLLAFVGWFQWRHPGGEARQAFWWTLLVLVPLGFLLDIFLGLLFFTFENTQATLGIHVWGFNWETRSFVRELPIEEFLFYSLGFAAILSTYVWGNEYFLDRYKSHDHALHSGKLVEFHFPSIILAVVLSIVAVLYKKFGPHPYQEGFPGWMVFLIWVGFVPAIGFYCSTRAYVNWRALALTATLMTLVSLVWEATLGVPYGWWGYVPEQMVGVFIGAWSNLPLEQPILWVMISFTAVIVYEVVHLYLHKRHATARLRQPTDSGNRDQVPPST